MKKLPFVTSITATTLLAAHLGGLSAVATESDNAKGLSSLTREFSAAVDQMGVSEDTAMELMSKFDKLSLHEKTNLVDVLESDNPSDALELGEPEVAFTIEPSSDVSEATVIAASAATKYEVTAHFKNDNHLLGVAVGTWNLRYKYQTGSGKVLRDYSCTNWYSGLSGFWNFSYSSTHRVASGQGYCTGIFRGSLVYKGSGFTMNKEMGMIVNGPGYVSRWLKNI